MRVRLDPVNRRMMAWMGPESPNLEGITDGDVLLKAVLGYSWNRWFGSGGDRLIDFCLAGVEKAGTTSLAGYLSAHPNIRMPLRKEVRYFNDERFFHLGETGNPEWYHRNFWWHARKKQITGDASPQYFLHPKAAERIKAYNPNMRVLVLLRPPADRMVSYWQMVNRGGANVTWAHFQKVAQERPGKWLFSESIKRWRLVFPEDQICFLPQKLLLHHHTAALSQVFAFLDVEDLSDVTNALRRNVARKKSDIVFEANDVLMRDMDEVERLLGWERSDWV